MGRTRQVLVRVALLEHVRMAGVVSGLLLRQGQLAGWHHDQVLVLGCMVRFAHLGWAICTANESVGQLAPLSMWMLVDVLGLTCGHRFLETDLPYRLYLLDWWLQFPLLRLRYYLGNWEVLY